MDSLDELKSLVAQTLDARGVLSKIRAMLRHAVFEAMQDQEIGNEEKQDGEDNQHHHLKKQQQQQNQHGVLLDENGIIGVALIKDFLEYYELDYTSSVLNVEANIQNQQQQQQQQQQSTDASFEKSTLISQLKLNARSEQPLLVQLIVGHMKQIKDGSQSPSAQENVSFNEDDLIVSRSEVNEMASVGAASASWTKPMILIGSSPTSPIHNSSSQNSSPVTRVLSSNRQFRLDEIDHSTSNSDSKTPPANDISSFPSFQTTSSSNNKSGHLAPLPPLNSIGSSGVSSSNVGKLAPLKGISGSSQLASNVVKDETAESLDLSKEQVSQIVSKSTRLPQDETRKTVEEGTDRMLSSDAASLSIAKPAASDNLPSGIQIQSTGSGMADVDAYNDEFVSDDHDIEEELEVSIEDASALNADIGEDSYDIQYFQSADNVDEGNDSVKAARSSSISAADDHQPNDTELSDTSQDISLQNGDSDFSDYDHVESAEASLLI